MNVRMLIIFAIIYSIVIIYLLFHQSLVSSSFLSFGIGGIVIYSLFFFIGGLIESALADNDDEEEAFVDNEVENDNVGWDGYEKTL